MISVAYIVLGGVVVFLALLAGPLLFRRLFFPRLTLALVGRFGRAVAKVTDRIRPGLDLKLLVEAANRYYQKAFAATDFSRRVMFLPFCLCPPGCPAEVDPQAGMNCGGECPECEVGKLKREAEALGYARVFVVPSSRLMPGQGLLPSDQFIRQKIKDLRPGAALGVVCGWHLRERLLKKQSHVDRGGYAPAGSGGPKSVLQGVLLDGRNCRRAKVDWSLVRRRMHLNRAG